MAEQDFAGKVALVTGAGSGLGAAAARELAGRGAKVVLADLDATAAAKVAAEIGAGARAEPLDVADTASVAALFTRMGEAGLVPDILVNSAGIVNTQGTFDLTVEAWNRVLAVNMTGSFLVAQAFARQLRDLGRGGAIVNVASTSGILASENRSAYVSSKHGVVGLTKQLALDFGPLGIRVNAVAPGIIRTPLTSFHFEQPGNEERLNNVYPLGRVGEPEDVAPVIAFLASDGARYVNGAILPIDGGYTAGRRK